MIREVLEKDAGDIAVLLKQLTPIDIQITAEMKNEIQKKIKEISSYEHMKIYAFEKNNRIVGTCTLGRIEGLSKNCRPFAIIENVVVLDTMRLQGIGKELVCHAITQSEKWNCYKVILETGTKNEDKLKFYEKCGMERGNKTAFIKRLK